MARKDFNINDFYHDLYKQFKKEYSFLYENNDNVAGYSEAVTAFDKFLKNKANRLLVCGFVKFRGDFISSDREAAAFMFALSKFE